METAAPHTLTGLNHLPVALGTEVLLELVHLELRVKALLVGIENNHFVILKLTHNDLAGSFRTDKVLGSPLIVRYMHRGSVYGFSTEILNAVSNPARLFFVKYPDRIEEQNIRTDARYDCIIPAEVAAEGEAAKLLVVDISRSGLRGVVKSEELTGKDKLAAQLNMDSALKIKMTLPGMDKDLEIAGSIRNINKDDHKTAFGMKIDSVGSGGKGELDKFIAIIASVVNARAD